MSVNRMMIHAYYLFYKYFKSCAESGYVVDRQYLERIDIDMSAYAEKLGCSETMPVCVSRYISALSDIADRPAMVYQTFVSCAKYFNLPYNAHKLVHDVREFYRLDKVFYDHMEELYRVLGGFTEEYAEISDIENDHYVATWPRYFN